MIELINDTLNFSFPEVHPNAQFAIDFQRTLRIPDDGNDYPLPPGLGRFPLKHVDDFGPTVPPLWVEHGGVMLPMYQSEALWLSFNSDYLSEHDTSYPFAIKVATGKINAVTGENWSEWLQQKPQDYMVSSEQPWLDGYCVEKGFIRQFIAMPLGSGYSAEEQITGEAEHGGIQLVIYPMKRKVFERRFPQRKFDEMEETLFDTTAVCRAVAPMASGEMGLAPGGRMRQEIYDDPFDLNDWDMDHKSRCFVHIANSLIWRTITGETPPTVPFTSKEYTKFGLPWFDYYSDNSTAIPGAEKLNGLTSVAEMGKKKGDVPLPENESVTPEHIVKLRGGLKKDQVREGRF
ncbi:MAG: hypothetical protein SWH54_15405 [Thermodesulfobacteriota bacterium]|nr:hypothetical protein [Thermodesulfobacteriota bacterium]